MLLFVDTETTGLSRSSDRIVQIAWMLTETSGRVVTEKSYILRPDGFEIPQSAARVHRITTDIARRRGVDREDALREFVMHAHDSTAIVGHNLSFDTSILKGDLRRLDISHNLNVLPQICTMRLATNWCAIEKFSGGAGFKWPRLEELYIRLFGCEFDNQHDALADVRATHRCFVELVRKGIIVLPGVSTKDRDASPKFSAFSGGIGAPHRQSAPTRNRAVRDVRINSRPADYSATPFTFTRSATIICQNCWRVFSVTLTAYETRACCPNCHKMTDAVEAR